MIPANTGDAREITLSATVIIGTLTDEAYTETITKTYTQEAGTNELTITWNQEVMNVYYIDGVSSNGFTKTGDFSSYSVYLKPDWVTYVSKAQSEDKFYVYYSTNQNAYQRSGTITIDFVDAVSGDTVRTSFMIVQAAGTGEVRITANPTSMQLGEGAYSNRTVTFTSTSSDTMEIAINTYPSWILNPTVSYGDKTATITFGVAANDTGASRSHSIICRQGSVSATCAINQGAIEQINVSFNQSNISVGSSATSSRCGFTVYSGTVNSTSFTAPSWITNLRVSNNEILFDVAANTETTERVGTVSVLFNNELTKGFTVTQAARELQPITVSFSQLTINALQASNRYENSYSINTGTLSRVETIDCPTWITIISTTNKIVFETSNNDNTTERSTTLKFRFYGLDDSYDAVFDVIQAPKVITNLNIAFNNQTVSCSNAAGNYSNTFTIVGTSNNVGQITKPEWVDNVSVDFNSRTVSFSVLANTSNSERTGNINIQFYDVENDTYPLFGFAVSQAGKTTVNLNIQFANQTINSTYTGGNFNNQFTVTGNYSNIGQITNPSWITNVSVSNNTVSFSVSSNSGNSRSGNISIPFYDTDNQKYVSFGFNVNQSGVSITDLDIAFDNQTVSVSKSGGVTNVGFTVTGTTNSYGTIQKPSWIKGVKVNFNTNKVVFSVEENTSPNNREGTVTIPFYDNQNSRYVSFGFNVNQQGDINVVFTPTSVASSGGTITATVNSIYTVTNWEIIQKPSYVTVNYNGNTATLIIGANNSTVRRDINLYWRVTAGGSNYSGYSTIKQYGITNNMAYPVYKDYVITDQVYSGFVEYHIESDSELVYAGKVYPKPNSSSVTWKLNEICSDYLGNDIIFTNGVHQIPGYLKEFYLESTGSNSGSYNFYNA